MSLLFVYSLDFARTRLANDAKGKGGERQFNGLIDVYVKTLKSDGIQGCTEASPSPLSVSSSTVACTSDSLTLLKPILLGWAVTVTAGLMSYPIDTIRRRMMMTSGGG